MELQEVDAVDAEARTRQVDGGLHHLHRHRTGLRAPLGEDGWIQTVGMLGQETPRDELGAAICACPARASARGCGGSGSGSGDGARRRAAAAASTTAAAAAAAEEPTGRAREETPDDRVHASARAWQHGGKGVDRGEGGYSGRPCRRCPALTRRTPAYPWRPGPGRPPRRPSPCRRSATARSPAALW